MNSALVALVVLYIIVIFIGKHLRKITISTYVLVGFITLIQVAFVLYFMYTMKTPLT